MTTIPPVGVLLIFLLPLFSFAVIALIIRPFFNHKSLYSGYLTIACIAGSLVLSIWTLISVSHSGPIETGATDWIVIGGSTIQLGLMIDPLTAVMVVVVSLCSLMVQIYSQGYMHGDTGYSRYYASMSLFTASMLGLVMAGNLLQLFVFWELVGLCSYLLIGFWYHKPSAAAAAKKAFLVTRIGDFGFLAAILYLFLRAGTFDIADLHHLAITGALAGGVLTWAAIGIFAGAVGKSAQFPLHVWLPDAMEGPTPVSALIHSSTMVTAGVFLVARCFPLFAASETALMVVAGIGGFTAIFAASMALVANDIKRVLAYCTISQLGYMMLGLGAIGLIMFWGDHEVGEHYEEAVKWVAAVGIFHLFNHAFCKALLFLASGSVNHATGTFDMTKMGGLRKHMPWTYLVYLIGTISMAGIWPLACFWSKDHILVEAMQMSGAMQVFFYMGMITAFMTAFYMFRTLFMTFHGEYRGGESGNGHGGHSGLHESPRVMLIPMFVLAAMAIGSGWLNANGWFSGTLFGDEHTSHSIVENVFSMFTSHHCLPLISLIVALLGAAFAYSMYIRRQPEGETVGRIFPAPYKVFSRKYWMDELYENVFIVKVLVDGIFRIIQMFDTHVVDGLVNGVGWGTLADGRVMRKAQTGQLQTYGLVMVLGLVIIIGFVFLLAR